MIDEEMPIPGEPAATVPPEPSEPGEGEFTAPGEAEALLKEVAADTASKNTVVNEPEPEQEPEKKAPKKPAAISAQLQSKLYVNALDGVQALIFTGIHEKKKVTEIGEHLDEVEELDEKLLNKVINLDDAKESPHYRMLKKLRRRNKIISNVPFSDEEKQTLMEPLEQYIVENGYKMPGWLAMTLALGQVIGGRIADATR